MRPVPSRSRPSSARSTASGRARAVALHPPGLRTRSSAGPHPVRGQPAPPGRAAHRAAADIAGTPGSRPSRAGVESRTTAGGCGPSRGTGEPSLEPPASRWRGSCPTSRCRQRLHRHAGDRLLDVPAPVSAADPRKVARARRFRSASTSTRPTGSRSSPSAIGAQLPGGGHARRLHRRSPRPVPRPRGLGRAWPTEREVRISSWRDSVDIALVVGLSWWPSRVGDRGHRRGRCLRRLHRGALCGAWLVPQLLARPVRRLPAGHGHAGRDVVLGVLGQAILRSQGDRARCRRLPPDPPRRQRLGDGRRHPRVPAVRVDGAVRGGLQLASSRLRAVPASRGFPLLDQVLAGPGDAPR